MNIFIFHNDLRLHDNTGLHAAIKAGKTIPIFVFTPEQIGQQNKYRSQVAIDFMCGALKHLDTELRKHGSRLHVFYGQTHSIVRQIIRQYKIAGVYCNQNYTPFSIERDKAVEKVCKSSKVSFNHSEDYLLFPIGSITTAGGVYKKFTPYFEASKKHKVAPIANYRLTNLTKVTIGNVSIKKFLKNPPLMKENLGGFKSVPSYAKTRNTPSIDTTHLSVYIKFGCVSIREVYHWAKLQPRDLAKQLVWRDFYANIVWEYPKVLSQRNFKEKANKIHWIQLTPTNKKYFISWCEGKTGFPIVDAAMRQLNSSGWMHNRGRLISAWFLTKVMGWHWKYGERYFAIKLIDYDPAQNNGNWQFCAGSGVDTDQYFRQFNPWLQSEKYDADAKYIKKWVPELARIPAKDLHQWYVKHQNYKVKYPAPMIDYEKQKDKIRHIYGRGENDEVE